MEISKFGREELVGQSYNMLKSNYHTDDFYKILWNTISSGQVWHGEIKNRAKDGSYFWCDTTIAPIIGKDGKPEKYISIYLPIGADENKKELQHEVKHLRSLIEISSDPLIAITVEGTIVDLNEAMLKVTGRALDELIGTYFYDYFTESEKAKEAYQKALTLKEIKDYAFTIRHKNGMLTDILCNISACRDLEGKIIGLSISTRDVTEYKQIIRDFTETKSFLDNILKSSTKYSIIGLDLNCNILSWNEGARQNYGYKAEEVIGKNANILQIPEDIKNGSVKKLLHEALEKGGAEGEFTRVRKDGSRFTASLVIMRRFDPAGNPVGFLLISNDISEIKKTHAQLEQALQNARSLIEASLDPFVTISSDGKITDVNEASVKVTGVARQELIGTDFSNYFTEPHKAREGYLQVFAQGSVANYPLTIRHKNGQLTDVLYNASVYKDSAGNVLGVFAAARDITTQKRIEQELAEQFNKEKKRLIELEKFQKITVGRELRMIELKNEIQELKKENESLKLKII